MGLGHGQKRDYISRDSQCARGATKNWKYMTHRNVIRIPTTISNMHGKFGEV